MRPNIPRVLALILASFCLSSCGDDDFSIYSTISGVVTSFSTGEPLNAAQVTLLPGSNTIQTSSDGEFSFTDLEAGQYTVSVQKEGYQANRKNVTVKSGEEISIVVTLSAIPK